MYFFTTVAVSAVQQAANAISLLAKVVTVKWLGICEEEVILNLLSRLELLKMVSCKTNGLRAWEC